MSESSPTLDAGARRIHAALLRAVARVGTSTLATAFGIDDSNVGRWRDRELVRVAQLLAMADEKVVPGRVRCFAPEDIEPLLAKARMNQLRTVDQLQWEDEAEPAKGD